MKNNTYILGLDIGSTTSKAVVLDNKKNIVLFLVIDSSGNLKKSAYKLYTACIKQVKTKDFKNIITTGYGRHNIPFSKKQITEITAHGLGTRHLFPKAKTIVDIGGQDSKIIKLDNKGQIIDFIMNDKCSAGCGRFIENMAKKLNTPLLSFEKLAKKSKKQIKLSNTCTVFAESEIISHLANSEKKENLIKAILVNLIDKVISIGNSIGFNDEIILTGGVAKNPLLKQLLKKSLKKSVKSPHHPQITGALGAALYGFKGL